MSRALKNANDESGQSGQLGFRGRVPPCPDGNPQRLCHPLGFRERNIGELELRVALGEDGVCQVIVDERGDEVYVRVVTCCRNEAPASWPLQVNTSTPQYASGSGNRSATVR